MTVYDTEPLCTKFVFGETLLNLNLGLKLGLGLGLVLVLELFTRCF